MLAVVVSIFSRQPQAREPGEGTHLQTQMAGYHLFFVFAFVFAAHALIEAAEVVLAWALGRPPRVWSLIPLLGSALSFKRDPVSFLSECRKTYGGVFTINLAGARIVLLSDQAALGQYWSAREDTLSLYDAVFDFGFRETLGAASVYSGSAVHRRLVRSASARAPLDAFVASCVPLARRAFLSHAKSGRAEAFNLMRSVALDVTIRALVGPSFLERVGPKFSSRFMQFQDSVEDATAKAMVLPRVAARGTLSAVTRARAALVSEMAAAIRGCSQESMAPYMRGLLREANQGASADEVRETRQSKRTKNIESSEDRAAEYIIGLLFAAHKNVAITSAQLTVLLLSHPDMLRRVIAEAEKAKQSASKDDSKCSDGEKEGGWMRDSVPFLDSCLNETLRLTQHTIGSMRKVKSAGGWRVRLRSGHHVCVPRGYYVGAAHALMGRREGGAFAQPDKFDPDGHFGAPMPRSVLRGCHVPFSAGVHACPGATVAPLLIKCLVLCWFRLTGETCTLEGGLPDLDYERATIAQRKGGCFMRFSLDGV